VVKRRDLRVVRGEERFAYTTGEVVEALQSAGVLTDEAIRIAREAERQLREPGTRRVELDELMDVLGRMVEDRVAPEVAQRLRQQTPPFVPLLIDADGHQEPFARRTLMASLEKLDLGFKEAHAVASLVEQGLRAEGAELIPQAELARRVAAALEGRYGRDLRLRYEALTRQTLELKVVEEDGVEMPFSRGILAQSVMAVGLGPEFSHNLAKRVEEALYRLSRPSVQRTEVRGEVARLLRDEAGEEFARRYELMRAVRRPDRPIILVVGGAPGVGKSAIASEVGYRLGIPRNVSTDSVRQALRSLIGPDLSPVLHSSSYSAWRAELLPSERESIKPKRKRVLRGFLAQVQQLDPAVCAIIDRNVTEATSLVMEGAHLVPGIAPSRDAPEAILIRVVLAVADEDDHRRHFGVREGQTFQRRRRQPYLEHFSEIRTLHDFIVEQAELEGVPVVEASDFDRAVEKTIEHVLDIMLVEYDGVVAAQEEGAV
jgi:2-phosphoglycerate kinase